MFLCTKNDVYLHSALDFRNYALTLQLPYALMMHEYVVPLYLMTWLKMTDQQQRCLDVKYLSLSPCLFKVTLLLLM